MSEAREKPHSKLKFKIQVDVWQMEITKSVLNKSKVSLNITSKFSLCTSDTDADVQKICGKTWFKTVNAKMDIKCIHIAENAGK